MHSSIVSKAATSRPVSSRVPLGFIESVSIRIDNQVYLPALLQPAHILFGTFARPTIPSERVTHFQPSPSRLPADQRRGCRSLRGTAEFALPAFPPYALISDRDRESGD